MPSKVIPLSVPDIGPRERAAVADCIRSGWVSSVAPQVGRFESLVAARAGGGPAAAVVSGTAALHLALLVAGVRPGDEVLVPALSFIATANAVVYCGARPVFLDVAPDTWGMDPAAVLRFLEEACARRGGRAVHKKTGRVVRAVVPMHTLGHPVDMAPLAAAARRFGVAVVEDAAEALGSAYRGRPAGSLGDAAAFSFNGNKVITTGGGGMVVSRKAAWVARARHLATQAKTGAGYFHDAVGFNYRLTGLQAALGCAQVERLDTLLARKARIAARYRRAFADAPDVLCMPQASWARPNNWLFTILVRRPDALISRLKARGIESRRLWHPLHRLPMYREDRAFGVRLADDLYARAVSLPSSAGLSAADQDRVIAEVRASLRA